MQLITTPTRIHQTPLPGVRIEVSSQTAVHQRPLLTVTVCLFIGLCCVFPVLAAPPQRATPDEAAGSPSVTTLDQERGIGTGQKDRQATGDVQPPSDEDPVADDKGSLLERHKRYMDSAVQSSSRAVDEFFAADNYEEESTQTQLRLRPEFYYRDEQGGKLRMKVLAKLHLPNISERLSLVAGRDPDTEDFDDDSLDDTENSIAGLQYFLSDSRNWNTSLSAGFRFNAFSVYFGPRVRYQTSLNDWSEFRFTQTLRWQTNNYWDIGSRFDLGFLIGQRLYFRQTVYGRWQGEDADEDGYRTSISSVLSQRLGATAGLQYEFRTVVHTRPETQVDEYLLSLRFRKKTRRDWLYYEIAPQVSFEEEFDYKANPGIRLRLEFFYGGANAGQYWRHTNEDTDDFTW